MVSHLRRYVVCALLLAWSLLPSSAVADTPPQPMDYAVSSEDGRYIFVMLMPSEESAYGDINTELRSTYPTSGLYAADNRDEPLWTVDWYSMAFWQTVYPLSDGVHLVRLGEWPRHGQFDMVAITFYAGGREIVSYTIAELVALPELLPESASHYQWLARATLDGGQMQIKLWMKNGERYTFDISSGAIVSVERPQVERSESAWIIPYMPLIFIVFLIALVFGGVWLVERLDR